MAVAAESGNMRIWDAAKDPHGASPQLVAKWPGGISAMTATPAGIVTGTNGGAIVLWPGRDAPGTPGRIAAVKGRVFDMHPVAGGRRLVVASDEGAFLVGLTDHRVERIATGGLNDAIADPSTGGYLISVGGVGVRRVRDGSSPRTDRRRGQHARARDQPRRDSPRDGERRRRPCPAARRATQRALVRPRHQRRQRRRLVGGRQARGGRGRLRRREDLRPGRAAALHADRARGLRDHRRVGRAHHGRERRHRRDGPPVGRDGGRPGPAPRLSHALRRGSGLHRRRLPLTLVGADGSARTWTPGQAATRPLLPPVPGGVSAAVSAGGFVAERPVRRTRRRPRHGGRPAREPERSARGPPRAWRSTRAIDGSPSR